METLPFCCSLVSCHRLNNFAFRPLGNNLSLRQSRALVNGRTVVMFAGAKSMLSFGTSCQDSYEIENLYKKEGARLLGLLEEYSNHVSSQSAKDNCNYYVADGNTGLKGVSTKADEVTKVLIPGLPEGSDGNKGSPISSCFWEWKPKLSVHYEKSGSENVGAPAVLFLPGFGVGTFHYEKQLRDLGQEYRVWALDFLGQGMSLPSEDPAPSLKMGDSSDEMEVAWGFGDESEPWAHELVYSVDLWRDQVKHFIEEVIGEQCTLWATHLEVMWLCTSQRAIHN
ncbi:putative alpha/Beta hydrolase, pheophytinase [Dioscorea sansibarensis]